MSKIICEVCGTSYPETATQCPICGCVRPGDAKSVKGNGESGDGATGYTYVKGGRFSKSNVRKRNSGRKVPVVESAKVSDVDSESKDEKTSKGLIITAIVLMLAIVAVVVFIVFRFFFPGLGFNFGAEATTTAATVLEIPCEDLRLDVSHITLNNKNDARMLYANVTPKDTTDVVTYTSGDDKIATVSKEGKIVAVGRGRVTITVKCGAFEETCEVECNFEDVEDTTGETTEATEETTVPTVEFKLNRKDMTLAKGESWVVYDGEVDASKITWTSDDTSVAKIENGKVTAVGGGVTNVYGEYQGVKVSCIVRCNSAASNSGVTGSGGGISEDGGGAQPTGSCKLYNLSGGAADDVTISVNESFTLQLRDQSGNPVQAQWSSTDSQVCTVSGGTVKGVANGTTSVTATYNGTTYSCVIRVN